MDLDQIIILQNKIDIIIKDEARRASLVPTGIPTGTLRA